MEREPNDKRFAVQLGSQVVCLGSLRLLIQSIESWGIDLGVRYTGKGVVPNSPGGTTANSPRRKPWELPDPRKAPAGAAAGVQTSTSLPFAAAPAGAWSFFEPLSHGSRRGLVAVATTVAKSDQNFGKTLACPANAVAR